MSKLLTSMCLLMTSYALVAEQGFVGAPEVDREQTSLVDNVTTSNIYGYQFWIALKADLASAEEREAAFASIEDAVERLKGYIPENCNMLMNVVDIKLADGLALDAVENTTVAVKDIVQIEFILEFDLASIDQESKVAFLNRLQEGFINLGKELETVAPNIHGTISGQPVVEAKNVEVEQIEELVDVQNDSVAVEFLTVEEALPTEVAII